MWGKVETLAMRNPSYQKLPSFGSNNSSVDLASPNNEGDDVDISYEKLEAEAREVCLVIKLVNKWFVVLLNRINITYLKFYM